MACSSGDDAGAAGGADASTGSADGSSALVDAPSGSHDGDSADAHDAQVASTCAPSGAAQGVSDPTFTPVGSGACSTEQLTAVFASCFAGTASATACVNLRNTVGYASCFGCIYSPSDQSLLAPILLTKLADQTDFAWFNTAGCIDALEPSEHDCAVASARADTCEYNGCSRCTEADTQPIPADPYGAIDQCIDAEEDGGCAAVQATETACYDRLLATDGGAASCLGALVGSDTTWGPAFYSYLGTVCGPTALAPPDAGPSDAGSPDAGSPDAGDAGDADASDGGS